MSTLPLRVFISSVQKELASERQAIKTFVANDPILHRFFTVFLFEDLPACDHKADEIYFAEVDRCTIYLGILGNDYGFEDKDGMSPTEREFDRATAQGKFRLIYIKGKDDRKRHPKMQALISKAGEQLIRRRFNSNDELLEAVHASLADYLENSGIIQTGPFDERLRSDATLDDIDAQAVARFVNIARSGRQFALPEQTSVSDVLTHLHLLEDGKLTNAALLLFGRNPQRFIPSAEVRCMHFHGTEIRRPAPSYQIYTGTALSQVDKAVDFVLSILFRRVGTREESSQAPGEYEIPPNVIREAVVNAVAHRDYASGGAVQVSVFADRVEVWNPGSLPESLTMESLRQPHGSIARNPRLCEGLFLAQYIEKYGTGTLMMIRESIEHQLPEPDFAQRGGEFTVILWRDWLTDKVLAGFDLNERQLKAIDFVKTQGRITNREYRELTGLTIRTASRDLDDLLRKGILRKSGTTGRNVFYELTTKVDIN